MLQATRLEVVAHGPLRNTAPELVHAHVSAEPTGGGGAVDEL